MKKTFKKFVSVALSVMLCAAAVPASFIASNAAGGTVTPKVAAGNDHTVVLKSDGTVWATGSNRYGQLGVGDAVLSGDFSGNKTATFTQCVDADGQPIQDATDVACGGGHTAVIVNGEVWQCGNNDSGQLGNTTVTSDYNKYSTVFVKSYKSKDGNAVSSPDSSNTEAIAGVVQIACGDSHTAVIINDGEVWQCGYNARGQLGNNSTSKSTVFVKSSNITGVTQIACGGNHTAVIVNGEVWQCGNNMYGQLGNTNVISGEEADNNYSKVFVKSSNITGATEIECGGNHTAVIVNGEVWQCGWNSDGQLGNTNVNSGEVDNNYSKVFVKSSNITGATQIACGQFHTTVILNNGEVWQCGSNEKGQLGNTDIGTGYGKMSTIFVKSSNITGATQIECGWSHTVAICEESSETGGTYTLYGVGQNNNGQLGLGNDAGTGNVLTFAKSTTIGDLDPVVPDIDSITALGESSSRSVTGAGQFVGGYRLDVEWSDLQYTYTAEWNIEDSKWVGAWEAADGGDQIVVKNGSATPCKVEFNFNANDEFKSPSDGEPGTKGTFADPNVADEPALDTTTNTVPLAVYTAATPATSQKTVKLGLEGIPNAKAGTNIDEAKTVGSVTVTLKSSDA